MPICASADDTTHLRKLDSLFLKFAVIVEESPRPYRVPACLQRCFRGRKRTSLSLSFNPVVGETRQLGLVLEKTFNARRIWVKLGKGLKLDCMFFPALQSCGSASS